jgi:hypothetical protein
MNRSSAWAGGALIVVGLLFLLANYEVLAINWSFVANLWPLALVIAGLGLIVRIPALFGVATVFFIVSMIAVATFGIERFAGDDSRRQVTVRTLESDAEVPTRAVFDFKAGAGRYKLMGSSSRLAEIETSTTHGDFSLKTEQNDDLTTVRLHQESGNFTWGAVRNEAAVKLHTAPVWDMTIDGGAAEFDINLEEHAVRTFTMKTGAASAKVVFGETAEGAKAVFEIGASSLRIRVPEETGVLVSFSSGLTSRTLSGFVQNGAEYRSEGYDSADKKLTIEVRAGASSVEVERY